MPESETIDILRSASNCVLSLTDPEGGPYGVPLSFAFDGRGALYFHSAVAGRKIDCIRNDGRASVCVIAADDVRPEEFTTYFRSVIASGRISVVDDSDEVLKGLRLLCEKYSPGVDSAAEIASSLPRVAVLRLDIEVLSGKEAIELTRSRS